MKGKIEFIISSYYFQKQFSILVIITLIAILFVSCQQKNPYNHGRILYENFCANCHMEDGTGLKEVIPPLANADYLINYTDNLPCLIRKGFKGEMIVNGISYNTEMPGVPQLTEFEITNVINYINTAWGNDNPITKHAAVRQALSKCE